MAREGLLRKIIKAMRVDELDAQAKDETSKKLDFLFPDQEAIDAINNKRGLTGWQINQVIQSIRANYYLKADERYLEQFIAEWTIYNGNVDKILVRLHQAYTNATSSLSAGKTVDVGDALWISNRIYVDDYNPNLKRIITKHLESGILKLEVCTQRKDATVENELRQFKKQINEINCPKVFANSI